MSLGLVSFASCLTAHAAPTASLSGYAVQQESTAEEVYALAASFYTDQNWSKAIEQFQILLDDHPTSEKAAQSRFYLAESLVQTNQHELAQQAFQKCIDAQPTGSFATRCQFRIAECQYLGNQFKEAKQLFNEFMEEHSADPLAEFALPYLGELYLRDKENEKGRDAYQLALKRFPTSGLSNKCRLGLAQSLNRLGQSPEAERFYRFVANQANDPLADDAQLLIGKMYAERGQWEKARAEFDSLIRKFPNSDSLNEARYLSAKRDLANGDWKAGWTAIEPLLDQPMKDNLFVRVALDAAVIAIRVDKIDRAKQLIDEVKKRNPDDNAAEFMSVIEIDIANRQQDIRALQKLVTAFEQRFKDSEHITRCIEPLARMHYDRGEFAQAAARYQQLIGVVSVRPDVDGNLPAWRYLLGLSRIGTSEYAKAIGYLQSIRDFGDNATFEAATSFAIATALSGDKRWQEAIPHYRKYLTLTPNGEDSVRCQADLAVALVKSQQVAEAVTILDPVAEKHADEFAVLAACEVVAEATMESKDMETSRRFFQIMAQSKLPEFRSRGTNGLVWSGDESIMTADNLREVIKSGVDKDLALEAVIGRVQNLQANNEHQQTVALLTDIIDSHPDSPLIDEARFRLAVSLQRIGGLDNSKRASELLQKFLSTKSEHKLADLARYELAWATHDSQQTKLAQQRFADIADNYPDSEYHVDSTYRAAMLARQLGDEATAQKRLTQLVESAPEHSLAGYAHYSIGEYQCQQENWALAIQAFEKLIESTAGDGLNNPARYWLAEAEYQSGNIAAAEKQFDLIKDSEFDKPEIAEVIWLRLAQCAAKRTDWATVEKIIAQTRTRLVADDSGPNFQLDYLQGRVFMSRAKFNEARVMFSGVLRHPDASGTQTAAMSQWMIGESWFHQEDYKQSLRAYLLVDSLYDFPKWRSLALLQAAKCHLHLGDASTARKTCERMLNTFPDSSHAEDARQLLVDIDAAGGNKSKTRSATFSK